MAAATGSDTTNGTGPKGGQALTTQSRRSFLGMTAGATAFALPPVRALAQGSEAVPGRVMNTLSTYMSAARSRALPEDVIEQAKYHLLDSLGDDFGFRIAARPGCSTLCPRACR